MILVSFLIVPVYLNADVFLEAPVISQGEIIKKTESKLEIKVKQSHDEAVAFYREALKAVPGIRYRDWADSTYIEDDGKLALVQFNR